MAWTYFTSSLSPGDILTVSQRNELVEALRERLKAADLPNNGWNVSLVNADGLAALASPLMHQRLFAKFPAATGSGTLEEATDIYTVITNLSRYYIKPAKIESNTGSSTWSGTQIWVDAAAELGVTLTLGTLSEFSFPSAFFWNLIKKAIQLLRWVRFGALLDGNGLVAPPTLIYGREGYADEPPYCFDWETAIEEYVDEEIYQGGYYRGEVIVEGGGEEDCWYVKGSRPVWHDQATIPEIWATGWYLAIGGEQTNTPPLDPAEYERVTGFDADVTLGGTTIRFSAIDTALPIIISPTMITETGAVDLEYEFVGYDDGSVAEAVKAAATWFDDRYKGWAPLTLSLTFYGRPAFVRD